MELFFNPIFQNYWLFYNNVFDSKNINKLVVYGELVCKIEMHALSANQAGPK